jgi:hypothetical protein
MTTRRFPAPWRADKIPGGYVARDANGQALVCVYSRENEAEARQAKVLTARQGAADRHQRRKRVLTWQTKSKSGDSSKGPKL